jgi:hypothetical protein
MDQVHDLGDATEEEILALRDLLVYGYSSVHQEAACRIYDRMVRLARKIEHERGADRRSRA